jgi:hypothetical protein
MRPTTTSAMLAMAVALLACSPTLNWRELRPEGSGIAMSFPCKPERRVRDVVLPGHRVRLQMLSCAAGGATYALAFADLPDPAAVAPALAELREQAAANIGAGPAALSPLQVAGMTPNPQAGRVALSGHLPDGSAVQLQAAFFAKAMRVYQASVVGSGPGGEAAQTFLAALDLRK